MKNFKYIVLSVALSFATLAFGADTFRNAAFNFAPNYVDYSFGGIQIGATSGTVIGDPFMIQNSQGQWVDSATSGTVIGDPFSVQNPQSNSTDMQGLLAYMSTQPFLVQTSDMYVNYNIVESTNNQYFYQNSGAGILSAQVELVDANTGAVLDAVYMLPSFAGTTETRGEKPNYTYNVPASYMGRWVYVRLNVSESSSVTYTSGGSTSMTYMGWSPNASGTFGKQIDGLVAGSTQLLGNYPNPVVNTTTISVQNTVGGVSLKVYDVLGKQVADLSQQVPQTNGIADVMFDASQLRSGIYFYRLQTADGLVSQREMIVKK